MFRLKNRLKTILKVIACAILLPVLCIAREYPDIGGILDFSKPEKISNRLFILTNPKSGSHLLLYSIIKVTQRPLRGRVPLWHFENDPPFFPPENMMNYPVDFSKPTTYWGHEYHILSSLNHSRNKLVFILRNYKENLASQLLLTHDRDRDTDLETIFMNEILNEGIVFKEYILRLQLFDRWNSDDRYLVLFEDLLYRPEIFIPQVMSFIEDDSEYNDFVTHYDDFRLDLMRIYETKGNRTGSGEDAHFFSRTISPQILKLVDEHVAQRYPHLWEVYLSGFAE